MIYKKTVLGIFFNCCLGVGVSYSDVICDKPNLPEWPYSASSYPTHESVVIKNQKVSSYISDVRSYLSCLDRAFMRLPHLRKDIAAERNATIELSNSLNKRWEEIKVELRKIGRIG